MGVIFNWPAWVTPFLGLAFVTYWLPSAVAFARKPLPNAGSIYVINFMLGWTLIGWTVAMAMAVRTKPVISVNRSSSPAGVALRDERGAVAPKPPHKCVDRENCLCQLAATPPSRS